MKRINTGLFFGSIMALGAMPDFFRSRRPEPKPEPTQTDHDRLAAAEAKRERKAAKRRKYEST